MIPTSAACNWIRRSALGRSSEFQCGKPITPSFSSPVNICICPLWLPGSFQGTVMFLYQGNPHWTQCTSLAWVVGFFMPRPYFCPSGREVTISDVFAEHPKPQGYMLGIRCVLVTLKTPLGGNLWNSIFLLPNDNGRK